jgi:conjugative transposon protein traQ family protein
MPVADEIVNGETVEIRLEIKPEGNFSGTVYTLRYFQPDGKGSLKMEDGTVLKPNDRYLLNEWKFRLYYTSQSGKESQTIDLYFEDNWGNLQQLTYDFNGKDAEEEDNNTEAA